MVNGELWIRLGKSASGPLLAAAGKLDSGTVESLLNVVNAAVLIRRAEALTLDLSQVTYVDVAGVAGLMECRRKTLHAGMTFVIAEASRQVVTAARYCHAGELLALPDQTPTQPCPPAPRAESPSRRRPARRCDRPPSSSGRRSGRPPAR